MAAVSLALAGRGEGAPGEIEGGKGSGLVMGVALSGFDSQLALPPTLVTSELTCLP